MGTLTAAACAGQHRAGLHKTPAKISVNEISKYVCSFSADEPSAWPAEAFCELL